MQEYNNIGLKLPYSGTIIVGKNMKEEYHGMAFTGPHSYEITYELMFKKGKYINCRETSGSYVGF